MKISFRNMVYEDALTILSYASPYDVELEVESGGSGSKPTTLLKKSVGPSSTRICHPLYRSQSIPELSQAHKSVAKRLFVTADPNESVGSSYSMNSTLKSSKSTPGGQSLERYHDETKSNHHHKFGIKVLPALDGTVHRIENQNEHNTNLERRHSRKMDAEKLLTNRHSAASSDAGNGDEKVCDERLQQRDDHDVVSRTTTATADVRSVDVPDKVDKSVNEGLNIPSEVPTEVHNAAIAARRNRKSSSELPNAQKYGGSSESEGGKSPQKNKRKAPAPPKSGGEAAQPAKRDAIDTIDSIADYTESLCDYVNKVRDGADNADARRHRLENQPTTVNRRNSESDTDSEMQNSFTTIELNPADITIHRTPVPEVNDDDEDGNEDDMYRKAASLGDLSKYENRTAATLERAQSLDMSADTGAKKRKAPLPPEDINESTEDLTKLVDQVDTFDRRKLKKSNEWGTLQDVIWGDAAAAAVEAAVDETARKAPRTRGKSNGTLERSKSAVEIKLKEEATATRTSSEGKPESSDCETSIELYNLPLSKRLTQEFIHAERMFNPDADNSLARIVNDGAVVKSSTPEEVQLDFQLADERRSIEEEEDQEKEEKKIAGSDPEGTVSEKSEDFSRALRYFEMHASASPEPTKVSSAQSEEWREERTATAFNDASLYAGRQPVTEEPVSKVTVDRGCRGCEGRCGRHGVDCVERDKIDDRARRATARSLSEGNGITESPEYAANENAKRTETIVERTSAPATHLRVRASKSEPEAGCRSWGDSAGENAAEGKNGGGAFSTFQAHRTKFEQRSEQHDKRPSTKSPKSPTSDSTFGTHFARRVINVSEERVGRDDDNDDDNEEEEGEENEYEFRSASVTANSGNSFSPKEYEDRRNISNVSVSSGENSEDSGLVRESMEYRPRESRQRHSQPDVVSVTANVVRNTYITEIKVPPSRESVGDAGETAATTVATESNGGSGGESPRRLLVQREIRVTSNGKPTSGKKPPVPPRRSDVARNPQRDAHERGTADNQLVYVSEYKSATTGGGGKGAQILDAHPAPEVKQSENASKKFEHWIFVTDKEQNRWSAATGQPQPVTNIMLSSRDDVK